MTITAKVICDSVSPDGVRLTTMVCRYPRFIHAEFMTHRVFSRNAASSRAIPVKKMIQSVIDDPAVPIHWGKNQPGMQAHTELDAEDIPQVKSLWLAARDEAVSHAEAFSQWGVHKQIVNRILEPFMHIEVVVTATEWSNFFALRRHKDAQPEIKALADAMYDAMQTSVPTELEYGQWHLPFVNLFDLHVWLTNNIGKQYSTDLNVLARDVSVARCARVSYLNHDGSNPEIEKDLALAEKLLSSRHMSPFEHVATPTLNPMPDDPPSNFVGWTQHRKTIPGESGT